MRLQNLIRPARRVVLELLLLDLPAGLFHLRDDVLARLLERGGAAGRGPRSTSVFTSAKARSPE